MQKSDSKIVLTHPPWTRYLFVTIWACRFLLFTGKGRFTALQNIILLWGKGFMTRRFWNYQFGSNTFFKSTNKSRHGCTAPPFWHFQDSKSAWSWSPSHNNHLLQNWKANVLKDERAEEISRWGDRLNGRVGSCVRWRGAIYSQYKYIINK